MFHRVTSKTQDTTPDKETETTQVEDVAKEPEAAEPIAETPDEPELEEQFEEASIEEETAEIEVDTDTDIEDAQDDEPQQTGFFGSSKKAKDTKVKDTKPMTATKEDEPQSEPQAGEYQQHPAKVQSSAPAYPGAYPAYGAAAAHEAAGGAPESNRRLTIGAGITMSGEIESCDYLLVEGTVEAALKGASVLDIAESGIFYGTVEIEEATIAGRFEGDIKVHGRLSLREGASVTGTIIYKELEIEAGAVIDGKLTPMQNVQGGQKPVPARNEAPSRLGKPQQAGERIPAPANSDGELFGKSTVTAAE